jgi:hypothetical protein
VFVGGHFLKSILSVIQNLKHFGIESHVRNKATMPQYKCSLHAIFPSFFTGIF